MRKSLPWTEYYLGKSIPSTGLLRSCCPSTTTKLPPHTCHVHLYDEDGVESRPHSLLDVPPSKVPSSSVSRRSLKVRLSRVARFRPLDPRKTLQYTKILIPFGSKGRTDPRVRREYSTGSPRVQGKHGMRVSQRRP